MKKNSVSEGSTPHYYRNTYAFLYKLMNDYKAATLILPLALYVIILLLFGDFLKISSNYFVIFPLMAFSFVFGLPGGFASGVLALPANLLIFKFQGHLDYAPANIVIAECTGIIIGIAMGFQSEFFTGMLREIEQRVRTESRLRSILKEKDTLLSELNHRVRNNLNIITSLIQLHSNKTDHPYFREELSKLKDRVYSMSLVHEQLFMENQPLFLDVPRYLDSLLDNMVLSLNRPDLKLSKKWPDESIPLNSDRVLYLGLIVHEAVLNSIKYGETPGRNSELSLSITIEEDNSYTLMIEDNGPGFDPEGVEKGLGLRLIEALCVQLKGSYSWEGEAGSTFRLNFRD